jgi:Zn-dependent protease
LKVAGGGARRVVRRSILDALNPEVLRSLPIWFVATLLSLTLHEAMHALVAKLGGDETAAEQVTLDPTPHIRREPFGMLLVPVLSFFFMGGGWMIGWASAPYDPHWAERHPKRSALMAMAGPGGNFLIAAVAAGVMHAMMASGQWAADPTDLEHLVVSAGSGGATALTTFLSILFSVNVLLGAFNLLPVAPLDGHAVVPLFLTEKATRKWFRLFEDRSASIIGMLIAWVIFGKLAWPVLRFAVQVLFWRF